MAVNKVIFRGAYDREMNKNFFRYYMLRNSFFMYLLTAVGIFCLFSLLTGAVDPEEDSFQYILMWSITLIGIFFVPFYTFFNIHTQSNRDYKKRKDLIETFEITKEKIQRSVAGAPNKVTLNWVNIAKVVEVNDAFYFFTVNEESFTISKKALVEGTIEGLRVLINTYLKKDKKGSVPYKVKDKEYSKVLKDQKKQAKRNK